MLGEIDQLKSEARKWIILNQIGLMPEERLIRLADEYISKLEEVPDWITKISLAESLEREAQLDLLIDPIENKDCKVIASEMLKLYRQKKINMNKIGAIADNIWRHRYIEGIMEEKFHHIDTSVYLIKDGTCLKEYFDENIENWLLEIVNFDG